jgi:hypothetical protein
LIVDYLEKNPWQYDRETKYDYDNYLSFSSWKMFVDSIKELAEISEIGRKEKTMLRKIIKVEKSFEELGFLQGFNWTNHDRNCGERDDDYGLLILFFSNMTIEIDVSVLDDQTDVLNFIKEEMGEMGESFSSEIDVR